MAKERAPGSGKPGRPLGRKSTPKSPSRELSKPPKPPRVRKHTSPDALHAGPGSGIRTEKQLERQYQGFVLNVERGYSIRQIAEALQVTPATIHTDLIHEYERRHDELGQRRKYETARSIAFYESIKRRAIKRAEAANPAFEAADPNFTDRSLTEAMNAQARIDKLLGLEPLVKHSIGIGTSEDGEPTTYVKIVYEKPTKFEEI